VRARLPIATLFLNSIPCSHGHRPPTYGPFDYFGEFALVVNAMQADPNMQLKQNLLGPSLATGDWTPEMVWDTGFIPAYSNVLGALTVEQCLSHFFALSHILKFLAQLSF
jgi:hypothetical protein